MKVTHIGLLGSLIGLFCALPGFASSICNGVTDNLVLNCGFETGGFTDWTMTPAASGSDFAITSNSPNSGTYDARFGASAGENDYIDQILGTTAGGTYDISFYVNSSVNGGVSSNGEFVANWNGVNILTVTGSSSTPSCSGPDSAGYDLCSFVETATSSSTELQFGGNTGDSYYHLDDVVVTQAATSTVPEPSSIPFAAAGLFGILMLGRRYTNSAV
jgi:hypothetical protein